MKHSLIVSKLQVIFFVICTLFLSQKGTAQSWEWGAINTGGGVDAWNVATDNSGNVYVAGWAYAGTDTYFGTIDVPSVSSSSGSYGYGYQTVVAKYDSAGSVLWAQGNTVGNAYPIGITTDKWGNLYLFGTFSSDSMTMGGVTVHNYYSDGTDWQYFITKFNPSGAVVWSIADGNAPSSYDYLSVGTFVLSIGGIVCDTGGNIYVTTYFTQPSITIGTTTLTNSGSYGTADILLAKYDSGGTNLWAVSAGGDADDKSYGITETPLGDIYICGDFFSDSVTFGPSTIYNSATPASNIFIARFNSSHSPVWASSGGDGYEYAVGLSHDNANNVYMTGGFEDATLTFDDSSTTNPNTGNLSLYLFKIDPFNVLDWHKVIYGLAYSYGGYSYGGKAYGYSIATDACGNVWVSGDMSDSINIEGHVLRAPDNSGDPVFIAGYDISGAVIGSAALQSGGDDQNQIACDIYGNVYLESDYYNYSTTAPIIMGRDTFSSTLSSSGEYLYVAKYEHAVVAVHDSSRADTTMCITDSITIAGTPGALAYLWNDGDTARSRKVFSTATYWVVGIGNCTIPTTVDTFHIRTPSGDTLHSTISTTACPPYSTVLTGAPGYLTYLWNTGSTADTILVSSYGTYWVFETSACNSLLDTFTISTGTFDTTYHTWDTAICASVGNITLRGSTFSSAYLWSTGSTNDSIVVNTSGNYYEYNDSGCHVLIDSFIVNVHGPDTTSTSVTTTECGIGVRITLWADTTYSSRVWNNGSTADSQVVTTSGLYWVTNNGACSAKIDSFHVVINIPGQIIEHTDTLLCLTSGPVAFFGPTGYSTYLWNDGTTAPSINIGTTGIYSLLAENACDTLLDTFNVTTINADTLLTSRDTTLCPPAKITLAGHPQFPSYEWQDGITGVQQRVVADTGLYYVISDTFCHREVDTFHLSGHPLVFSLSPDDTVCIPEVISVPLSIPGITYLWQDSSTGSTYTAYASGSYSVTVTDKWCHGSAGKHVYIPNMNQDLGRDTVLCSEQPVNKIFKAQVPDGAAEVLWNNDSHDSVFTATEPGTYWVKVTEKNCWGFDSVHIGITACECWSSISNAFTPNGDGLNDTYYPMFEPLCQMSGYRFIITNRWGQVVYSTTDPKGAWDGYVNGVPADLGVYMYLVDYYGGPNGNHHILKGDVTLIR
jgi:gliding motility-associated-like protein